MIGAGDAVLGAGNAMIGGEGRDDAARDARRLEAR
jgi:hypothetical protein